MMISPETYYEENLKGRTADEIMFKIRSLKQEIGHLKASMAHPGHDDLIPSIRPDEETQLACTRDYLERAKLAYEEAGGTYVPSRADLKDSAFQESIPYINKIVFGFGGYFEGNATRTFTFENGRTRMVARMDYWIPDLVSTVLEDTDDLPDKEELLDGIRDLHIGEWKNDYHAPILDGDQWSLEIYYADKRKPVEKYGSNAYPYNFKKLRELLEIDFEKGGKSAGKKR